MTNLSLKQLIQTEIFIFLNNEFKDLNISINEVEVTSCKNKEDGDYASNIALKLAKKDYPWKILHRKIFRFLRKIFF